MPREDVARLIESYRENPKVRAAQRLVEAAEARDSAAKVDGLPTVSLYGSAYRSLTPPSEATSVQHERGREIGISIDIPIFDGFAKSS